MARRLKLGVLISGRGSNLQALIDACADPAFPAEIALVIADRPAQGLERAERAGIATQVIDRKAYTGRDAFDAAMDEALRAAGVELVCLAGFMRILGAAFVQRWPDAMLNIHPSLLPAHAGLCGDQVHESVLASGDAESGCSVHYVLPEVDAGPILLQRRVPVLPGDTVETLAARVLEQEHIAYPEAVRQVAATRV